MDFLESNLKDRMMKKLSVKKQKNYMRQLILALAELKIKNVIHRDLKPDNIMIRVKPKGEEECVIIDFGLGTKTDVKEFLFLRCAPPGFLAPEIASLSDKKERQTCAVDMFSLGCIFFKM